MNELIVHISKANKKNVEKTDSYNVLDNVKHVNVLNILDYWIDVYYTETHVNYYNNYRTTKIYEDNQYKHINHNNFTEVLDELIKEYKIYNKNKLTTEVKTKLDDALKEKQITVKYKNLNNHIINNIIINYTNNIKNKFYNLIVEKIKIENSNSKIFMIGDLHSSLHSFLDFLKNIRDHFEVERIVENSTGKHELKSLKLKKNVYIYFLGDLLDRGPYSIEIFYLFMKLKLANMNQVFLTRGNHEDFSIYETHGFYEEITNQFPKNSLNITKKINLLLNHIPSLIFLNFNSELYHLCHGAIDAEKNFSPFLKNNYINMFCYKNIKNIKNNGIMWGDFVQNYDTQIITKNGYELGISSRNFPGQETIFEYNLETIKKYLNNFGITAIISGHQDQENILVLTERYDPNKKKIKINISNKYNLFTWKYRDTNTFVSEDEKNRKISFSLKPGSEFKALVTSSAAIVRQINNCYLELRKDYKKVIKDCYNIK